MSGDKDDGNENAGSLKEFLEVETVYARKTHVEYQATVRVGTWSIQEVFRGRKDLRGKAHRLEQVADGIANGGIVIHNENRGSRFKHRTLLIESAV